MRETSSPLRYSLTRYPPSPTLSTDGDPSSTLSTSLTGADTAHLKDFVWGGLEGERWGGIDERFRNGAGECLFRQSTVQVAGGTDLGF